MPSWPEPKNVNDYLKIISYRIFNALAIAPLAFSHDRRKKKTAGDIRKPLKEALLQAGPNE
jgi:hypothetical protein